MIDREAKKVYICKKPLKELKMLIAFGTGLKFEMHFISSIVIWMFVLCLYPYLFSFLNRKNVYEIERDGNVHFGNIFFHLVIWLRLAEK